MEDDEPESESTSILSQLMIDLNEQFIRMYMQKKLSLLQNSLPFVDNSQERRRRLRLVQTMYTAKSELEAQGKIFNLAYVDAGVEAIINGDWRETLNIALMYSYDHEHPSIRDIYEPLHKVFRETLIQAASEALPSDPFALTVKKGGAWSKSKRLNPV